MPKKSSQARTEKIVTWITPRKVGERPDVASITQEKARRMREWMQSRRIYPAEGERLALSEGGYSEFGDFVNLMQVLEYVWLGNGERAKKLLFLGREPAEKVKSVSIGDSKLVFEDVKLKRLGSVFAK